jgi:hypothetical protein
MGTDSGICTMQRKALNGGRLRSAAYDTANQRLELAFADHSLRIHIGVPPEIWRRLVSAPNPATFYEDRIAEEYAFERGRASDGGDARRRLDDLFETPSGDRKMPPDH